MAQNSTNSTGYRTGSVSLPQGSIGVFNMPITPYVIQPKQAQPDCLLPAQTIAAPGIVYPVLDPAYGDLVTFVNPFPYVGRMAYKLDVPRVLAITGTAGAGVFNCDIYGFDMYNQPMIERFQYPGGGQTLPGQKAFAYVVGYQFSAGTGDDVYIGVIDTFGLPYVIQSEGQILACRFGSSPVYTFNAADLNTPTLLTGDVRGTVQPDDPADNDTQLIMALFIPTVSEPCGVAGYGTQNKTALIGAPQFSEGFSQIYGG